MLATPLKAWRRTIIASAATWTRVYVCSTRILASDAGYRSRYHNLVGNLYYYRKDYPEAARHYRRAVDADPASADFHRYIGLALGAMGEFDEARREVEAAFALDRDQMRRDEELGALENTQGNRAYEAYDYPRAIEHYRRAVELSPKDAVYCGNLAQAWERLKEPGRGIANLDAALRWYAKAQKLANDPGRSRRIEALEHRREFGRVYGEQALDWLPFASPIVVAVASDIGALIEGPKAEALSDDMARALQSMRDRLARELGVSVPGVRFRGDDSVLPPGAYVVMLNDIPAVSGAVRIGHRYFAGPAERVAGFGVESEQAVDPVTGEQGFWIGDTEAQRLSASGQEFPSAIEFLLRHLEAVVRRFAAELIGHQEIVNLLETEGESSRAPILASDAAVSALTNVCKALAAEKVPIRPFGDLCRTFKALRDRDETPRAIVERLRDEPGFLERLRGREGRRNYVHCSETFEAEIRRSLYGDADRVVLAIEPSHCQDTLAAVRRAVVDAPKTTLVVGDPALRPFVRSLVTLEFPDLAVLSTKETPEGAEYAASRVELDGAQPPGGAGAAAPGSPVAERPDPAPSDAVVSAELRRIRSSDRAGFQRPPLARGRKLPRRSAGRDARQPVP